MLWAPASPMGHKQAIGASATASNLGLAIDRSPFQNGERFGSGRVSQTPVRTAIHRLKVRGQAWWDAGSFWPTVSGGRAFNGTVKFAESRLGKSRVGRVKGRDEDASRPDLRRPSLPR